MKTIHILSLIRRPGGGRGGGKSVEFIVKKGLGGGRVNAWCRAGGSQAEHSKATFTTSSLRATTRP